jgi:hypothetical protein
VLGPDDSNAVRRLNDLRATMPGDHTLQNILLVLSAKLELCSKLPIYEYEAASQGHVHCVTAFQRLAEVERRSYDEILKTLRLHLDKTAASKEAVAEGMQ